MERSENLKINKSLVLVTTAAILMAGCKVTQQNQNFDGMTMVTVRDFRSLDGCTFLLETEDGKHLQPANLKDSFQKEGLVLGVTYKKIKTPSICMKGEPVELLMVKEKVK
jgi:uncharacterized lipoprotein YajG